MRLGFLVVQYLGFFRVYHAVSEANQLARGRLLHPQLIHSPGRGAVHGGPAAVPDISVRRLLEVSLVRARDRKSTRLNSSHSQISYAVFCLKKKITSLPLFLAFVCSFVLFAARTSPQPANAFPAALTASKWTLTPTSSPASVTDGPTNSVTS